ncbi:MAG: beta-propeller fold lactonase family protein [Acidobacteriia bacterium]|nr:beta-propeller fold lactonase family protein [Terriglobia bacterium]
MRAATYKLSGTTTSQQAKATKQRAGTLWLLTALLLAIALLVPAGAQAQGNYVYVNDQTVANSINAYSVSSTGALTPLAGSPYSTGGVGLPVTCYGLSRITISSATNLMFVANTGDQTISVFQINPASGALTLVAGSPFASGLTLDACQGMSLAVTPDGAFLMASSNGQINTFSVAASGALAPFASTANCCTPMAGMVISANGNFLAVSNENSVSVYTIAAGVLTPVLGSPFPKTGTGFISGLDFSCAGDRLYGGEATSTTTITDAWTVNASGALTPVPGSPFHTTGTNSNDVHLSPDNTLLFESNQLSNSVNASNILSDGSLSNVGKFGSTTAVHVPTGMATDAGGRFLYIADDNFGVAVFRINAGGILTPLSDTGITRPGEIQDLAAYPPRSCASADLSITKSASPTVVAGSPIVYTITITNNGPSAASAVVSDTMPAGTTPGGNLKIVAATGAQRTSGVVTIHTTAPHAAFVGETVVITGVGDASFNGTFTIASVPDGSSFTYSEAGTDATSGGGSATTPNCQVPAGGTGVCGGAPATARSIPIVASTGAKRVSGVVTITTTAPHVLLAGQTVTITGVANTTFNGTFPIVSVPTPTTFTYSKAGVDATSGGGSAVTGQTLTVAFNSLANGETQTAILTTTTPTSVTNGTVISNTATIGNKSAVDAVPANNSATAAVTVGTPVVTALTVPDGTGPYGGLATLSAVLKNSVTNAPIAGKVLTFQLGGNLASALTDATGTATVNTLPIGTISVGTHPSAFTVSFGGDSSFLASNAVGTLVVTKAQLTVTADNQSRLYGDANPPLTYTITGFVNGDTLAVVSGTANCTTTATPASPAGTYPTTCTAGTLAAANYVFVFVDGTLTVNPAPLTVTVANASRAYGAANPAFTGTITGIKNGDVITATYSTTATATSPVGTYPITATLVDPGNVLGNYTVTNTPGTLTITAAALVVTANNAARLYGDPNPAFAGTIAGLVNGDNITATFTSVATPASPVGNYPIVPALSDPTNKLGNYAVTLNNGNLVVSPAPLVVTAANATRAVGAPNPVFTGAIVGIKNGDNITATYASPATATSAPGTYPIIPTLVDPTGKLGNYTVTVNNGTLTITAAVLTVTADNASRLYGDPNPPLTYTIAGFVNGDTLAVVSGTAACTTTATPDSPVGTYPITCTAGTIAAANYVFAFANGTLTVNPAPLTVTAANASRLYGAANPAFTGTITGIKNGDNITATYASVATPASNVGTYPIIPTLVDPTSKLGNYTVTSNNGTLTVTTAPLTVTAANASRVYGDPNPIFTGTITGLLNGDNITATYASVATPASSVGTYPIVPTLVDPTSKLGNYTVTSNNGTLTITPAPLVVTAANATRAFGDPNPAFTGAIVGIKNGDNITATFSSPATATSPAGTYPIIPVLVDPTGKLGNYTVTANNGTLTVTSAALVVTAANASRFYGDPDPVFTGTITGVKNGDTITATYASTATATSAPGTFIIVPTLSDGGTGALANYTIVINNGTLTVQAAPLTVSAANASRLYGAANPAFTGTITGIKNGDNITATYTSIADPTSNVGTYPITPVLSDPANKLSNYAVTLSNGTLTITPAPLSVTAANASRVYGDPNPAFTGTITGLLNGDNITATYSSVDATAAVGTYPIVPAPVDPTGKLGNYTVTLNNGTLTITPAPLSVTAANTTRAFGDPNPVFTGTIAGIKNGDNITATYSTTATATSPSGTYPIVPALIDPAGKLSNYTVTINNGTLTITQAVLTVTAANASMIFGDPVPALTGTITGLRNGDTISATYTTAATSASPVGTYAIVATLVDPNNQAVNYTVVINNGTLTISPAPLTVTAASASRLYGDPNPAFTGTITGLKNGNNISAIFSAAADPTSPVGTYAIIPTLVDPNNQVGNYAVTLNNGLLVVNPAPLSVTADSAARLFGDPNPAFTGTLTGVRNGDNITATFASAADPTSPVGTYPIVPTLLDPASKLANYVVTSTNGVLTVSPAPLVIQAADATRLVGDPNPVFTGTIIGLKNTDVVTASYSTTADQTSPAGTYPIIPTADPSPALANYTVTLGNGTLTVQ